MPNIQVDPHDQFPDMIGASSLFIDSVTEGLGVFVQIFYANGEKEEQEIVSGSKIVTGKAASIQKVIFHNPSVLVISVSYHFSMLSNYDEGRVLGDITAVTQDYNETVDGNEYIYGHASVAVLSKNSYNGIKNPSGSDIWVDVIHVSNQLTSGGAFFCIIDEVELATIDQEIITTDLNSLNHNKYSEGLASTGKYIYGFDEEFLFHAEEMGYLASSFGTIPYFDAKRPLVLAPGKSALFFNPTINAMITTTIEWKERAQ